MATENKMTTPEIIELMKNVLHNVPNGKLYDKLNDTVFTYGPSQKLTEALDNMSISELLNWKYLDEKEQGKNQEGQDNRELNIVINNTIVRTVIDRLPHESRRVQAKIFQNLFAKFPESEGYGRRLEWLFVDQGHKDFAEGMASFKKRFYGSNMRAAATHYKELTKLLDEESRQRFDELFGKYYNNIDLEDAVVADFEKGNRGAAKAKYGNNKMADTVSYKKRISDAENKLQTAQADFEYLQTRDAPKIKTLKKMSDTYNELLQKQEELQKLRSAIDDVYDNVTQMPKFDNKSLAKSGLDKLQSAVKSKELYNFLSNGGIDSLKTLSTGLFGGKDAEKINNFITMIKPKLNNLVKMSKETELSPEEHSKKNSYEISTIYDEDIKNNHVNPEVLSDIENTYEQSKIAVANATNNLTDEQKRRNKLFDKAKERVKEKTGQEMGTKFGQNATTPKMSEKWAQEQKDKQGLTDEQVLAKFMKNIRDGRD